MRSPTSNFLGVQPVTLDDIYVGLQASGGAIVPRSNRPVTFGGRGSLTIPAGQVAYGDAVDLEYVNDAARFYLDGKKMAVSFHVAGTSGLMTWHAKSLQTSYGMMRVEFLTNSTLGTIDHLHPNRAGYLSMAKTIDIGVLAPPGHGKR